MFPAPLIHIHLNATLKEGALVHGAMAASLGGAVAMASAPAVAQYTVSFIYFGFIQIYFCRVRRRRRRSASLSVRTLRECSVCLFVFFSRVCVCV